jgi:hypothetical protein
MAKVTQRKTFEQHSERWQREARRDGITPSRWNRWIRLSDKTRRATDPRKYAQGESVAKQRLNTKREQAAAKILSVFKDSARAAAVRRGVQSMSTTQLNGVLRRDGSKLVEHVRQQARKNIPGQRNPFWYK